MPPVALKRAAMIGCGMIAEEHARAIARIDGIEITAWCDVDASRADGLLERYGGSYSTSDPGRIFSDEGIDAVYICTHHDSHAPLAIRACEAGKQIMLEKPMALTLGECHAIGEAVEKSGVTLMTAFKLRFCPMVQRVREFIHEPVLSIAQVMDDRWPDDFWAQDPVKGGGNVLSQGCHAADLLCYLNRSEPVRIYAEGGTFNHRNSTVVDSMVATIQFANGRLASLALGDSGTTPFVSKFSFQMADGRRSAHLHNRLKSAVLYDGVRTESYEDSEELGMVEENRAFARALLDGTAPPTGWRDGLRATTMILKAFEALRTGVPQIIEL